MNTAKTMFFFSIKVGVALAFLGVFGVLVSKVSPQLGKWFIAPGQAATDLLIGISNG